MGTAQFSRAPGSGFAPIPYGQFNLSFADGHGESVGVRDLYTLQWNKESDTGKGMKMPSWVE